MLDSKLWHGQLCKGTVRRYPAKHCDPSLLLSHLSPLLAYSARPSSFLLLPPLSPPSTRRPLAEQRTPVAVYPPLALPLGLFLSFYRGKPGARCPRATTCCDVQRALDAPGQSRDSARASCAAVLCIIPYTFVHGRRGGRAPSPSARNPSVCEACARSVEAEPILNRERLVAHSHHHSCFPVNPSRRAATSEKENHRRSEGARGERLLLRSFS